MWWYVLEDLLLDNNSLALGDGQVLRCKTTEEKVDAFLTVRRKILSLPQANLATEIQRIFDGYKIDWMQKCKDLAMNWDQIVDMSRDSLCTIGGHTKNHLALNGLNEATVTAEVVEANRLIEKRTGRKVEHFAYPFGSRLEVGPREFDIVRELGFKTATTTRHGTIYSKHKDHLECLPRVMLTENFDMCAVGRIRRQKIVTA